MASSEWNFSAVPNSALYGSDALASVVSITTQRGDTPLPLFSFGADGGTFGTYHENGSVGGYWKRLDYFSGYSGYGTQNSTPDSQFHRDVYLGNLGFQITPNTTLRATVERAVVGYNSANQIAAYGIPDDAADNQQNTFSALPWTITPMIAGITCCAMAECGCVRNTPSGRPPEFLSIPTVWDIPPIIWERRSLSMAPTDTPSRRRR